MIEVTDRDEYLTLDGAVVYRYDAPTLRDGSDDPLEPSDATADTDVAGDDEQSVSDEGNTPPDSEDGGDNAGTESLFDRLQKRAIAGGGDSSRSENTTVDADDAASESSGDAQSSETESS